MQLPTQLLQRRLNTHKGDFGHIFILAGSLRFSGAAALCSLAAMRSGAGLVTLGVPKSLAKPLIRLKPKEAMIFPLPETKECTLSLAGFVKIKDFIKNIDVLVIGPGLTMNKSTQGLVRKIISNINKPMVIDADGLNASAGHADLLRVTGRLLQAARILTPHAKEMARILGVSVGAVEKNRKEIAKKAASDYNLTIVLKGHNTVVADSKGNLYINKSGNPGMATAGSGDVLTGIIVAFLAQGLSAFNAAKYAAYIHGSAGDLAAKKRTQIGMIASDIIEMIPEAIKNSS
jgi:ADP-dependent NAD(P)H-hydrate dehydratase / NAD(P)H-hydrate epimerase